MTSPTHSDPRATLGVGVDFGIKVGERTVPCRISYEALADHFESGWVVEDMEDAYVLNREAIDSMAMALYNAEPASGKSGFTRRNPLLIKSDHL
jgi:hypothetical protein